MKTPEASFFEWQRQFGSEMNCLNHLKHIRWPTGFICPRCSCEHSYQLTTRDVYECSQCHKQTSVTA
ncbi:MAG: transposase, partial [Shewanella sp.]